MSYKLFCYLWDSGKQSKYEIKKEKNLISIKVVHSSFYFCVWVELEERTDTDGFRQDCLLTTCPWWWCDWHLVFCVVRLVFISSKIREMMLFSSELLTERLQIWSQWVVNCSLMQTEDWFSLSVTKTCYFLFCPHLSLFLLISHFPNSKHNFWAYK